jgi:serine/threonine protein kinase
MFKVLHTDPPIPDNMSPEGKDFLRCCLKRNPTERPTATKLLEHPFIRTSNHYSPRNSFLGIKSPVSMWSPVTLNPFSVSHGMQYLKFQLKGLCMCMACWCQDTVHSGARDKVPRKNDSCKRGKHANGWVHVLPCSVYFFGWSVYLVMKGSRYLSFLTPAILHSDSETSSARSSGSLTYRLMTPLPNLGTNSLSPPPLSSASNSGSAAHTPKIMHFSVAYHRPSPLPKPNGKEAINLISHWITTWQLSQHLGQKPHNPCAVTHSWQFLGLVKNIFHVKRLPLYDHREMLLNGGALWGLLYCLISEEMIVFSM